MYSLSHLVRVALQSYLELPSLNKVRLDPTSLWSCLLHLLNLAYFGLGLCCLIYRNCVDSQDSMEWDQKTLKMGDSESRWVVWCITVLRLGGLSENI